MEEGLEFVIAHKNKGVLLHIKTTLVFLNAHRYVRKLRFKLRSKGK